MFSRCCGLGKDGIGLVPRRRVKRLLDKPSPLLHSHGGTMVGSLSSWEPIMFPTACHALAHVNQRHRNAIKEHDDAGLVRDPTLSPAGQSCSNFPLRVLSKMHASAQQLHDPVK